MCCWAVSLSCYGAGIHVVRPKAAAFLPYSISRGDAVTMPQCAQVVRDSDMAVTWGPVLLHIPLRIMTEWRPWVENGRQWLLSLFMLLVKSPVHIHKMCRGACHYCDKEIVSIAAIYTCISSQSCPDTVSNSKIIFFRTQGHIFRLLYRVR